ncbi:hypothetical protein ACO7_570036 [Thiomonas arsenitoxydans]|nr:hypothetical protein ACO7_570036 [Thiomonas arsenitoxydans]
MARDIGLGTVNAVNQSMHGLVAVAQLADDLQPRRASEGCEEFGGLLEHRLQCVTFLGLVGRREGVGKNLRGGRHSSNPCW